MKDELYSYNYVRNRNKLFTNLISMIDGITCDGEITEQELLYLDTWILEAQELQNNVIFQQIRDQIIDIRFDGEVSKNELEELKSTLIEIQRNILDLPNIDLYSKESDIHLLSGLCKGIISDNRLSDDEVYYLKWWINQNSLLKNNYPGSELYRLIDDILSDGVITEDERHKLKSMLIDFTGSDPDNGVVDGLAMGKLFFDAVEDIDFTDKVLCFTGKFIYGSRSKCENKAEKLGCSIVKDWRSDLDYLIVGTLNSRDWIYQSFGRKIEKAKEYQKQGHKVKVITEEQWLNAINKLGK